MFFEANPETAEKFKVSKKKLKQLPTVKNEYQDWYSEAVVCISQLLPDRLEDFTYYYKPLKLRKAITYESYTVSDYLKGLGVTRGGEQVVGPKDAFASLQQQVNIVNSLERRFESSLFDTRALVQADLFENELDAAEELNKKGFHRGGGAVAGVVLEGHLRTVCTQHKITTRKNATLGKLNDVLKDKGILDVPTWRHIQHLIDIRNLCDHKMAKEPTETGIRELIDGVRKVSKTVF